MDSVYGRLSRQVYFNILGINLGKNKNTEGQENILSDYTKTMEKLYRFADYFVINVSSPNTEGLRSLQESSALENLLSGILLKRDQLHSLESYITGTRKKTPVLVKISPDLEYTDVQNMITSLKKVNIDGVIISNTTVSRAASLQNIHAVEIGGLSGKPLAEKSLHLTKTFYEGFEGKIPIINVGGVFTGEDVYKRLCHGASLVQIYSVLALNGPGTVTHIKGELAKILESKKIKHVSDIIGSDTKFPKKS